MAVAYEHCITMKHFRFGDKIEDEFKPFSFSYFQASEFSRSAFGCHENSDPGKHYGISGILPYNRNVTLQTLKLFSAYAWLYNAAA